MFRLTLALGGMTVRQLRANIDYDELRGWQLFEAKNGPLHESIRFEGAIARAVAPFLQNVRPEQLMPWPVQKEEEASLEGAFKLIAGVTKTKAGRKKIVRKRRGK